MKFQLQNRFILILVVMSLESPKNLKRQSLPNNLNSQKLRIRLKALKNLSRILLKVRNLKILLNLMISMLPQLPRNQKNLCQKLSQPSKRFLKKSQEDILRRKKRRNLLLGKVLMPLHKWKVFLKCLFNLPLNLLVLMLLMANLKNPKCQWNLQVWMKNLQMKQKRKNLLTKSKDLLQLLVLYLKWKILLKYSSSPQMKILVILKISRQ